MTSGISIEIIGDDSGVERMLALMAGILSPAGITGWMESEVEPFLKGRARARFANEGDDVVGKWAGLKESTQEARASLGYNPDHPINVRTSEMEQYVTDSKATYADEVWGVQMTLPGEPPTGLLEEKMMVAQIGGGEYNTVPRPVLGLNETDMAAALLSLANYIQLAGRL